MLPYVDKISLAGPDGETDVTISVQFGTPLGWLPKTMDNFIKRELQNSIVRIMERARKDEAGGG